MPNTRSGLDRWLAVASVASVGLTIAAISFSYFTFDRFVATLYNADAIQTPAVFADLIERGGSFADWSIAPAPAVVPEYGMFALAYLVGGTYAGRILAYAIIQVLLFWAALFGLSWATGMRRPLVTASLTVSVMGLFCMLRVMDFTQLIQSAFHFGGFILQIVTLALMVLLWRGRPGAGAGAGSESTERRSLRRSSTVVLLAAIGVITVIGSLNDALFVVQLAGPVCVVVVVGVLARRIPWRRGLTFVGVVAISALAGWKLYVRVFPHPALSTGKVKLDQVSRDLDDLVTVWGNVIAHSFLVPLLILSALALGVTGAVLLLLRRNPTWMRGTTLQSLAVFALISGVLPLAAAFVGSSGTTPRYFLPLFYWPCILGAMLLTQLNARRAVVAATALACVFSLMSTGIAVRDVARLGLTGAYYPETVACLDEAAKQFGVSHAVGTYWVAKPTQELSRTGLTVTVVTGKLKPRVWISSTANVYPTYDAFIDSATQPDDALRRLMQRRFGKPKHTVSCGDSTMLVWRAGKIVLPKAVDG